MLLGNFDKDLLETDRIIIQIINKNPELFLDITIKEFAAQANAAVSTISKFVRRIGFENYRNFQNYLLKSYSLQKENDFLHLMTLKQNDALTLKEYDFLAINETIQKIDFLILDQLVNTIIHSRKVWVIGQGNSFLAAKDLANSLNNIDIIAFSTNEICGKSQQLNHLNQNDILIFISEKYSKKSYQELTLNLKKQKVKIGLITSLNKFFIDKKIDFVINFFAFPKEIRPELVRNAKIQQIFINNMLINAIIKKKENKIK